MGLFGQSEPCAHKDLGPATPAATALAPSSNPRRFNFDMGVPSPDTDCESLSRRFTGGLDARHGQKRRRIIALAGRGTYSRGKDWFSDRRRTMTKKEIGAADIHQLDDAIAWRHFWLANVAVEADGRPPVRGPRPELRPRKDSLSQRLQRLHHMRAILGRPRH
jgi:hypothetical protein